MISFGRAFTPTTTLRTIPLKKLNAHSPELCERIHMPCLVKTRKSRLRKIASSTRKISCLVILASLVSSLPTKVAAQEPELLDFGLQNLAPMRDQEAEAIQCQSLFTEHFGISFISGILYDPNTGSSIKAHAIELSKASDFIGDSISVNDVAISQVNWDRIAEIDVTSTIVDFQASMRGLLQATGFALSTY